MKMSKKCEIYPLLLLLSFSLVPLVFCADLKENNNKTELSSGLSQKFAKATAYLEDFITDSSGLFSLIPLQKLHHIRIVVDPILGLYGYAFDTVLAKTQKSLVAKEEEKIQFRLYSDQKNNESYWNLLPEDDKSIRSSYFMKARPIKILIHGFQDGERPDFQKKVKNAYLEYTDHNVIVADWGTLAYSQLSSTTQYLAYPGAVRNMITVSYRISDLIVSLLRNGVIKSAQEIHLIGYSLGAHIAGQTGFFVKHRLGSLIGRITGLDPARKLLETSKLDFRLDKTDAKFVDVIHTSKIGMYAPIGHADFYPNGGRIQKECYDGFNAYQNPMRALNDFMTGCSHPYAYKLFILSIQNWEIIGCTCSSWANYKRSCKNNCKAEAFLGEYCPPIVKGIFFLDTRLPEGFHLE